MESLSLIIVIGIILLGILWILLPYFVYQIRNRLDKIIQLLEIQNSHLPKKKETNELDIGNVKDPVRKYEIIFLIGVILIFVVLIILYTLDIRF